jgi:SAM-dependent methyltransferase
LLFTSKDRLYGTPGEFSYHRCIACRTVYQNPRIIAEDLYLCYPENYYTHHIQEAAVNQGTHEQKAVNGSLRDASRNFGSFRDLLRDAIREEVLGNRLSGIWGWVGKVLGKSATLRERSFYSLLSDDFLPRTTEFRRALDVGCGSGQRMLELRRLWDVEGVEWDPISVENARRITGCKVWQGDFRLLDLPLGQYGLISMNHVFEHFGDPVQILRRIKELLAPNGRAVLVYPNPESLGATLFGAAWFPWEVPRHLGIPPLQALIRAALLIGLKPLRWRTSANGSAQYFALSRAYKMGRIVDQIHSDVYKREKALEFIERIVLRLGKHVGEEAIIVLQNTRIK